MRRGPSVQNAVFISSANKETGETNVWRPPEESSRSKCRFLKKGTGEMNAAQPASGVLNGHSEQPGSIASEPLRSPPRSRHAGPAGSPHRSYLEDALQGRRGQRGRPAEARLEADTQGRCLPPCPAAGLLRLALSLAYKPTGLICWNCADSLPML